MKRYKEFKVLCKYNQSSIDLLNILESQLSSQYQCDRYQSFIKDDCLAVHVKFDNLTEAKIILLATNEPDNCVAIVNIVPSEQSKTFHIGIEEYNSILCKFRNEKINPIITKEGNTTCETEEDYTITDIIPKSYSKLNHWLNQFPLSRHPLDEERWYDFLISLVDNNEHISSEDLAKYIKEACNWSDEDIDNLTDRYVDQIGLLRYYVEHE